STLHLIARGVLDLAEGFAALRPQLFGAFPDPRTRAVHGRPDGRGAGFAVAVRASIHFLRARRGARRRHAGAEVRVGSAERVPVATGFAGRRLMFPHGSLLVDGSNLER